METYTRLNAKHFDGLRIDNAHSTPLHVAQHLLDVAREENPHIYVFAELFTSDQSLELLYTRKLVSS